MPSGWDSVPDSSPTAKSGWDAVPDTNLQSEQKITNWQDRVKPLKLTNGAETVQREDGYVWQDSTKGFKKPKGWYKWEGNRWVLGPDEPGGQTPMRYGMQDDDAIIRNLGYDPSLIKQSRYYKPGELSKNITNPNGLIATTFGSGSMTQPGAPMNGKLALQAVGGLAHGVESMGYGMSQGLTRLGRMVGVNSDADVAYKDMAKKFMDWDYKTNWQHGEGGTPASGTGDVAGQVMTTPIPPIGKAATLVGRIGKGALRGAAAMLPQPVDVDPNDPNSYAKGKAIQETLGAISGAIIEPAAHWAGNKITGWLSGTGLGRRLGIPDPEIKPDFKGAPELGQLLEEAGIKDYTPGMITGDAEHASYEASLARKDPRFMKKLVRANQQATGYAQQIVDDLKSAVKEQDWRGIDQLREVVESKGKRWKEAQKLLDAIQNSGDDTLQIAHKSGNLNLLIEKLQADANFDKATAIADLYGPVKTTETLTRAKRAVNHLTKEIGADSPNAPYMLQDIAEKIESGKKYSFSELRTLRTKLNGKIRQLTDPKAVSPPLDVELNAYKEVLEGVEADLDKFAKSHSSGLRNAWKKATDHYREKVVPYKAEDIAKPLADADPIKLKNMFHGKNPYEQKRMFELLDPKGRKAIQSSLIEDAFAAGEKTKAGVSSPTMSAARVASALEKLESNGTMDVVFPKGDNAAVRGMARIMRMVSKSDNVAWIPPTGESLERLGSETLQPHSVTDVAFKAVRWWNRENLYKLYSNPKGRVLLQVASRMNPENPALAQIVMKDIPEILGIKTPSNVVLFTPIPKPAAIADNPQESK